MPSARRSTSPQVSRRSPCTWHGASGICSATTSYTSAKFHPPVTGGDRRGPCDTIVPLQAFWRVEVVRVPESVDDSDGFCEFVGAVEPRLRRALVAAYGSDAGREAAADALAWAWQHWDRVRAMDNPGGYLWRVGQTAVRRTTRRQQHEVADGRVIELELVHDRPTERAVEPALDGAL